MAEIGVNLRDELGLRVPSTPEVTISAGDSVTFTAEQSADSVLFFSPETASILRPNPGARVEVAPGQSVTFAFASAGPGSYGAFLLAPNDPRPEAFDFGPPSNPPVLKILTRSRVGMGFGVIVNNPIGSREGPMAAPSLRD